MDRVKLVGTNLAMIESDFAGADKADKIYWDTDIRGLGLRFRRGGGRSWIFQRKVDGADCRLTLGPYPDMSAKVARGLAQAKQAEIWQGRARTRAPPSARRRPSSWRKSRCVLRSTIISLPSNPSCGRYPSPKPGAIS